MFRTVPLSIITTFSLCTQQWYMSYRFSVSLTGTDPSWSWWSQAVSKPVWHIPLLCVQWKTSDVGQRNCPKHVEFYSKNKFEKLVHLVGFIIRTQWFTLYITNIPTSLSLQSSRTFCTECVYVFCLIREMHPRVPWAHTFGTADTDYYGLSLDSVRLLI